MKESNFIFELKKDCDAIPHCFFYKIPDAYNMDRFSPKKPFDCILLASVVPLNHRLKFQTIAIEAKMVKKKGPLVFSMVKEHQIKGLMEAKDAGAGAYIAVNYRWKGYNKVFVIDIYHFLSIKDKYEGVRKSLPFSEVEKLPQLIRKKIENKTAWDIRSFLSGVPTSTFFGT